MDTTHIFTVTAFLGSASGSLALVMTSWTTERRKHRIRRIVKAHSQQQKLYKKFIQEASRLYADALVKDRSELSQLVGIYALIGQMRLISNDDVIANAEKAGRLIVETYLSPERTLADVPALLDEMDPLRDFAEACRRELVEVQQR
jgi:Xaa-Pro aminopeptidase